MSRVLADTNKVTQHWDRHHEELPYLMVKMSDGRTVRYNPEILQPKPVLADKLEKFTDLCIGYERKQKK